MSSIDRIKRCTGVLHVNCTCTANSTKGCVYLRTRGAQGKRHGNTGLHLNCSSSAAPELTATHGHADHAGVFESATVTT